MDPLHSKSAKRMLRYSSAFTLTFFLLLVLSTATFAQGLDDANTPVQPSKTIQTLGKLSFTELCKTPEGQQFIIDNYDPITLRDLQIQWESLKAHALPTADTFDEYKTISTKQACEGGGDTGVIIRPLVPEGGCDEPRLVAPYYDVKATVQKALALDEYYRSSSNPDAGSTFEERSERRNKAIVLLLKTQESVLSDAYQNIGCKIIHTAECTAGTGQVRICDRTLVHAPPDQEFIADSLKGGRHVKEGPGLVSPTVAWYSVGKTGHGTNFGFMEATTQFTRRGATRRAASDVDNIRREFINLGLSVDKTPDPIAPNPTTDKPKLSDRLPRVPAKVDIKHRVRSANNNFYDVTITNTGGSPAAVSYRIHVKSGFFTTATNKWKVCKGVENLMVNPGQVIMDGCHEWRAVEWYFERN